MSILKVVAVLLAGATSIVAAEPPREERSERTSYRGARRVIPNGEWFEVASPTPAAHGREFIAIDPESANARFSRLRLAAASGRLEVRTVRVDYADGTRQVIRVDKQIRKGRPALVELKGTKQVQQVVVTTARWGNGTYTVEAVVAAEPSVGS